MIRESIILAAFLSLAGCASASSSDDDFTQAEADALIEKCGAPKSLLTVSNGQLTMWPIDDLDDDIRQCVLGDIIGSGKSNSAFVGRERFPPDKEQ